MSLAGTISVTGLSTSRLSLPLVHPPRGSLPVLLSVAHSGTDYPDWLVRLAAGGLATLEPLEDPLVDRLAWRAIARGIGAVIARAPRAAIDCNREEDELDPMSVEGAASRRAGPHSVADSAARSPVAPPGDSRRAGRPAEPGSSAFPCRDRGRP